MTRRMAVLLIVLAALASGRWLLPPSQKEQNETVQAIARASNSTPNATHVASDPPALATEAIQAEDAPGNAFSVRTVTSPPNLATVVSAAPAVATVTLAPVIASPSPAPPAPAPPPPPPFQVIGTWDDAPSPGVFLSTPTGTVLARVGTVVMAEYRITQLTTHQVTLAHVPTSIEWSLPIPRPASRP